MHPLRLSTPESNQVVGYLERCIRSPRLNGRVVAENAVPITGFDTLRVVAK